MFADWSQYNAATMNIEQVRELRSMLQRSPWEDAHRVFIMSGERMLHWDVLLKLLEELSEDTYLAIHTGNLAAVPDTIVSRCFIKYLPYVVEQREMCHGAYVMVRAVQTMNVRQVFQASSKDIDSVQALQEFIEWLSGWASPELMEKAYDMADMVRKGARPLYACSALALRSLPAYRAYLSR
jgi:hypothetical protein